MVHQLYQGEAAQIIEQAFEGTVSGGAVNRQELSKRVFGNPGELAKLEAIVHPLVRQKQWEFIDRHQTAKADLAVLEVPLLFETAATDLFDAIIVASAPAEVQKARLLQRPGMTPKKVEAILARQAADSEKRARADFVVETGVPHRDTERQIDAVLNLLLQKSALAYQRWAERYGHR